jgi:hypothetical protein
MGMAAFASEADKVVEDTAKSVRTSQCRVALAAAAAEVAATTALQGHSLPETSHEVLGRIKAILAQKVKADNLHAQTAQEVLLEWMRREYTEYLEKLPRIVEQARGLPEPTLQPARQPSPTPQPGLQTTPTVKSDNQCCTIS